MVSAEIACELEGSGLQKRTDSSASSLNLAQQPPFFDTRPEPEDSATAAQTDPPPHCDMPHFRLPVLSIVPLELMRAFSNLPRVCGSQRSESLY